MIITYDPKLDPHLDQADAEDHIVLEGKTVVNFDFPMEGPGRHARYNELLGRPCMRVLIECKPDFHSVEFKGCIFFGGLPPVLRPNSFNTILFVGLGNGWVMTKEVILNYRNNHVPKL